jgi:hypothetical protein
MIKSPTAGTTDATLRTKFDKVSRAKAVRPTTLAMAIVTSLYLFATPQFANATVYSDTYTLQTTNQSMWAPGAQAAWSYNSGFQGGAWGTYAGSAPVSGGVNAITGSSNATITPAVPGIPGYCTSTPWGDVCTPAIPGIPAVTADTRTGAAVTIQSSGKVGVVATASANGGAVAVILPVSTQLNISDPLNGVFHVSGVNTIGSGASISTVAPSFQAGVSGVINLDNKFSGTGCVVFAGCSSSSSNVNVDPGQFSIVGLNTANTKPLSAFGVNVPMVAYGNPQGITAGAQTVGYVTPYQLSDASGGSVSGGTLSMSNNQTLLNVAADLTGIAQFALDFPVDVLNPSIDLGVATIAGTLLDVQAGVNLGITQSFSFDPNLQVTLVFDEPVSELEQVITSYAQNELCFNTGFGQMCVPVGGTHPVYGQAWVDVGNSVTINLAQGADLKFTGAVGNLLSRTYSLANVSDFTSNTLLSIDPMVAIQAGCFDISLKLNLGGYNHCAYDNTYATTGLANISVAKQTFELGGFNTASFDFAPNGGDVPEPETLLLTALGLLALALTRSKKGRAQLA